MFSYQSKCLKKCFSELFWHERINDEIDWGIDECYIVHQVPQGAVAPVEEGVVDGREHAQNSLKNNLDFRLIRFYSQIFECTGQTL